jgi:hypothetical protein
MNGNVQDVQNELAPQAAVQSILEWLGIVGLVIHVDEVCVTDVRGHLVPELTETVLDPLDP